ncbi:MAG TPA: hypothetical protein VJH20_03510 [Candidatus Nanoarchaeia archaeon]|nr:hypothetical protein [Candidatus Nanoarchaeia archaeon]
MNALFKTILGLFVIIVGIYIYISGWLNGFFAQQFKNLLFLILGNIPSLIILIGVVILILGFSDLGSKN